MTADLEMEKARLGEMEQLDVISKAITYSKNRRSEAEVRAWPYRFPPFSHVQQTENVPFSDASSWIDPWVCPCAGRVRSCFT